MTLKPALLSAAALGAIAAASPAYAQHMEHEQHQAPPAEPQQQQKGHSQHQMPAEEHAGHKMAMTGALGSYPMAREASGTAWRRDTSEHGGPHLESGEWTFMAHGGLNLVYDWQETPRGDEKTFVSGMLMGMARRPVGDGTLQFKAGQPRPADGEERLSAAAG